ncbi:hypothetical protein [uncultured Brevundimonas sp.]|uniref:hypothetical protein n=1 Tax=uncultured Brevundimonas sp. TaxID=213418 RepID=UPI00262F988D|nr:hypothetical protein [uncultured Brevundimonas sp.]
MTFSPTDAAFEGFRLTRREPQMIVSLGLLYFVFTALFLVATYGPMREVMTMVTAMEGGAQPDEAEMMAMMSAYGKIMGITFVPNLIVGSIMQAAILRAYFRPEDKRYGYIRLGKDEARLTIVNLLITLIVAAVSMVGFGVVGVLFGFGMNGFPIVAVIGALLVFPLVAALIWLAVKLSLSVPISFTEGKIGIADSFRVTKGRFWPLLGMMILTGVLVIVVSILLSIITTPLTLLTGGGIAALANDTNLSGMLMTALFVWAVTSAVAYAVQSLLLYTPVAAAWKAFRG